MQWVRRGSLAPNKTYGSGERRGRRGRESGPRGREVVRLQAKGWELGLGTIFPGCFSSLFDQALFLFALVFPKMCAHTGQ